METSDETQLFAIQVEKQLCMVLGHRWSPTGMSIETLVADIDKRLIRLRKIESAPQDELKAAGDSGLTGSSLAGAAPLPDKVVQMIRYLCSIDEHIAADLIKRLATELRCATLERDAKELVIKRLTAERDSYKSMVKDQRTTGIPDHLCLVPREPTEVMIEQGAIGMASFQENSVWPDSWDKVQVKGMRHDAKKAWRYMIAAGEVKL